MSKLLIFGSKKNMPKVIDILYRLGVYHIIEHDKEGIDIGEPISGNEYVSKSLIKARSILTYWSVDYKAKRSSKEYSISEKELLKKVDTISDSISGLKNKLDEISNEMKRKKDDFNYYKLLHNFKIKPALIRDLASVKGLVGTLKSKEGLDDALKSAGLTYEYKIANGNKSKNMYICICYQSSDDEAVKNVLQSFGFNEITVMNDAKDTALKEIVSINKDFKRLKKQKDDIESQIVKIKKENLDFLLFAEEELARSEEKKKAPLRFAASENLFFVKGFVPSQDKDNVTQELKEVTKGEIYIEEKKFEKGDVIPIELDHPKPVNLFEFFLNFYTLPQYKEIDPTLFTFITFPMLFGFMLGDIGYGITTLFLFIILKKMLPQFKSFMNMMMFSSGWTIIFGLLFGEVFGEEVIFGYELPHILSRLHQINELLILSLIVGAIHVNAGLVIGFMNELSQHGIKAAIFEKASWFVLEISVLLLVLAYYVSIIPPIYGYACLIIAVIMLYKGEGIRGLIELPSIFSNILSYARLMAIGLASAGLAVVVNQFAKDFFAMGFVGIVPAILLLVIGHTINIALGLLGPFLHSLRLHYVEFYSKFYKGGGTPFSPFGMKQQGG